MGRRAGRDSEFVEYFTARGHWLRRLAYGLCGDWHTADDLVQATFVRLYRHWDRVQRESVDAYTRRILVNAFLSHRRGRRRESVVDAPPDRAVTDVDLAQRVAVHRALAGLAPRQRAVVVLRYLEDLPVAEVAALLGVAEGTVKSQCARGIESLREALGDPAPTWE
jgi:RNA polymerase sigma-70 factor (sigma-E family)